MKMSPRAYNILRIATYIVVFAAFALYFFHNSDQRQKKVETPAPRIESTGVPIYKGIGKKDSASMAKWIQTKADKIHKEHPGWDSADCEDIAKGKVWVGMHYSMLVCERGDPNDVHTSNYGHGNKYQVCWHGMDPSCFYFGDDQVITSFN